MKKTQIERAYSIAIKKDRDELRRFLADANGYIRYALTDNRPASEILATLTHDIAGILKRDLCFLPRVHGYSEK